MNFLCHLAQTNSPKKPFDCQSVCIYMKKNEPTTDGRTDDYLLLGMPD